MKGTRAWLAVAAVTLASAAWLLRCAFAWGPGYDEWWHVWIGEARTWAHLWRELHVETHPPLSHLGVTLLSEPGDAIQWARLVAILPAICTLPLWFATARRFGVSVPTALTVLAAMAFAHAFIGMGITVRGYSLAMAFAVLCLWGCAPFVVEPGTVRRRDAWAAAIGATGAVWSIYTEGLVVVALAGAFAVSLIGDGPQRRALGSALRRHWLPVVVAVVGGAAAVGYWRSTRIVMMQTYMPAFMPHTDESALDFLVRGTSSLVALFTAAPLAGAPWAAVALAVAFVVALVAPVGAGSAKGRRFVALAIVGVLAQLFVAAMARQLPFGGQLRHQYPLFPLLALALALGLDASRGRRLAHGLVLAAFAAVAAATSVWSYRSARVDEFRSTPFDAGFRDALTDLSADGDTILVRRYGLIPLYVALRGDGGFEWRGAMTVAGALGDRFAVRLADRALTAIVSARHFAASVEFDDGLFDEARDLLAGRSRPYVLVLATSQPRDGAPSAATARVAAGRLGLRIDAERRLTEGVLLRVVLEK